LLARLGLDGAKWAAEFRTTALRLGYSDMDEGWLIGWFANAIMAGCDSKPAPDVAALVEAGNVMADAIRGDYIVPGSAAAWFVALAAWEGRGNE
jgi:hypothetical protein